MGKTRKSAKQRKRRAKTNEPRDETSTRSQGRRQLKRSEQYGLGDPESSKPASESHGPPPGIPVSFGRVRRKASFAFSVWHFFTLAVFPEKTRTVHQAVGCSIYFDHPCSDVVVLANANVGPEEETSQVPRFWGYEMPIPVLELIASSQSEFVHGNCKTLRL